MECEHCGWLAITPNPEGFYFDGAGGECSHCGFPGQVSVDRETEPYWITEADDPDARCHLETCEECTVIDLLGKAEVTDGN